MYWDEIWEATDQKRITAYVKKCDLTPDERHWFFELTRYAFMHRRKQLGASLRKAPEPLGRADAELSALFAVADLEPSARAEQLTNDRWQALARAFAAV